LQPTHREVVLWVRGGRLESAPSPTEDPLRDQSALRNLQSEQETIPLRVAATRRRVFAFHLHTRNYSLVSSAVGNPCQTMYAISRAA